MSISMGAVPVCYKEHQHCSKRSLVKKAKTIFKLPRKCTTLVYLFRSSDSLLGFILNEPSWLIFLCHSWRCKLDIVCTGPCMPLHLNTKPRSDAQARLCIAFHLENQMSPLYPQCASGRMKARANAEHSSWASDLILD
jgi:hypothetical protein